MKQKLKEVIILTASYYGKQISSELLQMYHDDLEDLNPAECIKAYQQYRRNPANRAFPLPAQIRALVNPTDHISPEMLARETAARVSAAVPKFGWNNARSAEEYIGPVGWSLVQRQGGWTYICEHLGTTINPTSFQAQCRDQLIGDFQYGADVIDERVRIEQKSPSDGDLQKLGELMNLLVKP